MRYLPYCFFVFCSLTVFYSAQCQINITPTSFCAGDTVILNASALIESQEGTNNSSLQFSSGNYMRIPISDALSDFEQVTIEFWYYQISSGEEFIIATEYFNTGWGFHNENPNILQWRVEGGPYSLGGSNFSIPNNEWIHVAGVYDSQELRLYVNGNLIASEAYTGTMSDSRNEDIVVNRHVWASGSSSRLSGYLDELRISGIARYNDNFTPPEYDFVSDEQTLGLWHFDDLSGNMLSDDSGFNNHGQSNGVGTTSNVPYSDYNTASNVSYVWSNGETQSAIQVVSIDQSPYSVVIENGGTSIEETIVLNPNMTCCPGPGCCLDGQTWDWDQMGCVITNPTDTNLDGCTNLTDLMDILSAYGDCAVSETSYSLSFDGVDDYVDAGNCNFLPNTSITIATWLKSTNDLNIDVGDIFVSDVSWSTYTVRLGTNGALSFRIQPNAGSGGNVVSVNTISNGYNYADSIWHHLACTWDGGSISIYVDGIQVGPSFQTNFNSVSFTNDNATIGCYPTTSHEFFEGELDDLHIWDSALTQEQIQSYMSTPPTGNEEGLVGYWDFNEGTGSTLTDQTSNGNDGIINGATWSSDVPTAP